MSLRPEVSPAIPEETVRVARASFPKGGRYMRLRDELGAVFDDCEQAPNRDPSQKLAQHTDIVARNGG